MYIETPVKIEAFKRNIKSKILQELAKSEILKAMGKIKHTKTKIKLIGFIKLL